MSYNPTTIWGAGPDECNEPVGHMPRRGAAEPLDAAPSGHSFCAVHIRGDVCMPDDVFRRLLEEAGIAAPRSVADYKSRLAELLKKHAVRHEHDLWTLDAVKDAAGTTVVTIMDTCYKPSGNWDPIPLSNDEIDKTLWQWERKWPAFCNLGFTMVDFANYDGTPMQFLKKLPDLMRGAPVTLVQHELRDEAHVQEGGANKRLFASVLNSDLHTGPGKHWTCILVDARTRHATIEFFNSSGNAPYPEVVAWFPLAKRALLATGQVDAVDYRHEFNIQHQRGNTECGVYCLYYIWSRLNGAKPEDFKHGQIADDKMTAFRAQLFRPT